MDSHENWHLTLEEQEEERLRLKRKEWYARQKYERKHEERKLKMIEEYERNRAGTSKKQKLPYKRRSKSSSPQRKETSPPDYKHFKERKASVIVNDPDSIIDKKELRNIKITIHNKNSLPKNENMSNKIERDIVNPDDIILPRRPNEGARPIFQSSEIKETEKIRTLIISQNEQFDSEEQPTSRKNSCTCKRLDMTQYYCDSSQYKSIIRRDDRIDEDKYHDRRRSSTRDSKEKDRNRTKRRDRSSSHSSCSTLLIRKHSRSRYRSRSHSPISEQIKERRLDNDKNKFSSESYPDQSHKLDNRVSSKPSTNHPFSNSFYNPYVCLSRPIPIPRIQTPPMLMPIFPGYFPAPYPMNVPRWRQPPPNKTRHGRGTEIHRY